MYHNIFIGDRWGMIICFHGVSPAMLFFWKESGIQRVSRKPHWKMHMFSGHWFEIARFVPLYPTPKHAQTNDRNKTECT